MINGDDLRRKPYAERKSALRKLLRHGRGIQYVEHAEGHGDKLFAAASSLGLEECFQRSSMRPIARAVKGFKSESPCRNSGNRRYFLNVKKALGHSPTYIFYPLW